MSSPLDDADVRRFLERHCYRMLGSLADAEDVVHDAFLAWERAGRPALDRPRAWFAKTCTRLCLDRLRQNARRREEYVGEWLPEPFPDAAAGEHPAEIEDSLSMALLVTIERLDPRERAAFLLHDVFGESFAEIADVLDVREDHCRQLAHRARTRLRDGDRRRPRAPAHPEDFRRLTERFFSAVRSGDLDALRDTLAEDVVVFTDGGGKASAANRPLHGRDVVGRFFHGIFRQRPEGGIRLLWFNGRPGVLLIRDGQLDSAWQFDLAADGRTAGVYIQRNPDKLAGLAARGLSG